MQDNQEQKKLVPKIIWGAILMSHLIIFYVATNMLYKGDQVETDNVIQYVILAAGVFVAIASIVVNKIAQSKEKLEEYFTFFVLSICMAEAVHIFGMISIVLKMSLEFYYAFLITGIILHLYMYPKLERFK